MKSNETSTPTNQVHNVDFLMEECVFELKHKICLRLKVGVLLAKPLAVVRFL